MIAIGRALLSLRPLFIWLLALLPCLATLFYFSVRIQQCSDWQEKCQQLCKQTRPLYKEHATETRWLQRYGSASPYFLNQTVETLQLLAPEIAWLHATANHPALMERPLLQERLSFLCGSDNQITFAAEASRSTPHWKESEERLFHPVQISEADLWSLLQLLDSPNAPQLILLDFRLQKMDFPFHNQGFECDFRLLKRDSSSS